MTPRTARTVWIRLALAALSCLIATAARASAGPDTLADSTWVDRWKLRNGLEVSVRHVPRSSGVAVILAYRIGRNQDPRGRSGMADLACEVLYTAAAGDLPARTREEMETLRPLGWNTQVAPRFSLISELATVSQFPGVLRQVATRLRGVTVTDSVLRRARREVLNQQGTAYEESPHLVLFGRIRDLSLGASDQELVDRLAGRTLAAVTTKEVADRLRRLYVPANAVLALAGDLEGVDLHALVGDLFEDIPGGTATPEPPLPAPTAASRAITRRSLNGAMLGVGLVAPALTDTAHAGFYFRSLIVGRFCEDTWGQAPAPLPVRFRYPVLADEQIVQFFPPVAPNETDPEIAVAAMDDAMDQADDALFQPANIEELRRGNEWIFGGAFTPSFRLTVQQRAGALHTLASTLAIRALWGSEEFWAAYRERYRRADAVNIREWSDRFRSPDRMIRVLLTPARQ